MLFIYIKDRMTMMMELLVKQYESFDFIIILSYGYSFVSIFRNSSKFEWMKKHSASNKLLITD